MVRLLILLLLDPGQHPPRRLFSMMAAWLTRCNWSKAE
jgi:hypothetical protein